MKKNKFFLVFGFLALLFLAACPIADPLEIDIFEIQGVTPPVIDGIPVTYITRTSQFTGTVTWYPNHAVFLPGTQYTATITLSPIAPFNLQDVIANSFTVDGATATNPAGSGVIRAVFPLTPAVIDHPAAVQGVSIPETGYTALATITATPQFTGTVSWSPSRATFWPETQYTATITLSPREGFTFHGIAPNSFTVAGAPSGTTVNSQANADGNMVITAVFPPTEDDHRTPFSILEIGGLTAPVFRGIPVTAITPSVQFTGTVNWSPAHTEFRHNTIYTATIVLTPEAGYTPIGVAANSFTVSGVPGGTIVSNEVNSGVITVVFPPTGGPTGNAIGSAGGWATDSGPGQIKFDGQGREIEVTVTMANGVITTVVISAPDETIDDYMPAVKEIVETAPALVIQRQAFDLIRPPYGAGFGWEEGTRYYETGLLANDVIDIASGASYTFNGIMNAGRDAVQQILESN